MRGHALLQQGDTFGGRDAFDASLAAARSRSELFETLLTLLSLIALDRLEGIEPAAEIVAESRELTARLKVRAAPPMPKLEA